MGFPARRRLFGLLTALLFAFGSVGHVYAATQAMAQMSGMAMESSMPDHGPDCGGDKAERATCMAICATSVAVLAEPVAVVLMAALQDVEAATELPPPARSLLPEPRPPKR